MVRRPPELEERMSHLCCDAKYPDRVGQIVEVFSGITNYNFSSSMIKIIKLKTDLLLLMKVILQAKERCRNLVRMKWDVKGQTKSNI